MIDKALLQRIRDAIVSGQHRLAVDCIDEALGPHPQSGGTPTSPPPKPPKLPGGG